MFFRRRWPQLGWDEIKRRARLLVVDDTEFAYLELFKRDGYTIDQWRDVDNLAQLENGEFDVVMLDIRGVGRDISHEEGLGVLKHIRAVSPGQLVIAYSASDYDLRQYEFFRMADRVLQKSADYVEFKREVDELLRQRFSVEHYVERITDVAGRYAQDSGRVRSAAVKAIRKGDPSVLERCLRKFTDNAEAISLALRLAEVAIQITTLAKSLR